MKARKTGSPARTNGNGKTAQGYIAGIGASGALLAGAVVSFVFLVGAVSFEVWPTASGQGGADDSLGVAELSGPGSGSSEPSLGEAVSLLAAAVPSDVPAKGSGGLSGGGGSDQGSGGGTEEGTGGGSVGGSDGSTADTPDDPGNEGSGGSGGGSNGSGGGNGPGRDTGNTGSNGGGTSTTGTTGGTGSTGSSGGSGSGGSGGGGSNHSDR